MYLSSYYSILPKDQPIYFSVKKFKYYKISGIHNDWLKFYYINKGTYIKINIYQWKILLDGLVNNTAQNIWVVSIGAIDADNIHSSGYYMVEF